MKKYFLKLLGFYIEVVGFLAAVIFFLLAFPVMIFVKLTGQTIELEW
jgi:hypothetical protein|tara:strand:+ start:7020 stop:7160 length:141 start_codon:yes stop_codon:yes gene_type:complete